MKAKKETGKLIYITYIVSVLMVVVFYYFSLSQSSNGHISNFIFNLHEPSTPLPIGSIGSNQQSFDLSTVQPK